jgi:hypothetical protein
MKPTALRPEPTRAKLRIDIEEPIIRLSSTDAREPNLVALLTESVDPKHIAP